MRLRIENRMRARLVYEKEEKREGKEGKEEEGGEGK